MSNPGNIWSVHSAWVTHVPINPAKISGWCRCSLSACLITTQVGPTFCGTYSLLMRWLVAVRRLACSSDRSIHSTEQYLVIVPHALDGHGYSCGPPPHSISFIVLALSKFELGESLGERWMREQGCCCLSIRAMARKWRQPSISRFPRTRTTSTPASSPVLHQTWHDFFLSLSFHQFLSFLFYTIP